MTTVAARAARFAYCRIAKVVENRRTQTATGLGIRHHALQFAVLDLLAHQFEQARDMYADTWLGFTESQLTSLLEEAGFREIEVAIVARDEQNPQFQTVLATGVK